MPEFGNLTVTPGEQVVDFDPTALPALPWALPRSEAIQLSFEVDLEATRALLPAQLSRPVPPFARLFIATHADSPIGAYAEALLLLSCRSRMEPKQYVVSVVVTTEAARRAYAGVWGLPAQLGTIDVHRERHTAGGTEAISATIAAGRPLATVQLPDAYAVEPAMIRYDPFVSVRVMKDGEPEVIQFSGTPTVHGGWLAKGASLTCQTDAWVDPWFKLRTLNMISATFAVADLELTAAVVLQQPAGAGSGGGVR